MISAVILVCLLLLVYVQVHNSQKFEWGTFWKETRNLNWWCIFAAAALIHFNYILRALRWAVFLRPIKTDVSAWRLIPSQIIGFTGLALLGRPGELIRPYLVSKREQLTFSSQLAVWTVERLFDLGSIGVLLAINVMVSPLIKEMPSHGKLMAAAFLLLGGVTAGGIFAYIIRRSGPSVAAIVEKFIGRLSPNLGKKIATKIIAFGDGLHTVKDAASFAVLSLYSIVIWIMIVVAYLLVARAYPDIVSRMSLRTTVSFTILLLGCSVAGSMIALPAVGGGPQLATISAMVYLFKFPQELATSCGIMFWLTTFASVIPTGLAISRFEHVSLTNVSQETATEGN